MKTTTRIDPRALRQALQEALRDKGITGAAAERIIDVFLRDSQVDVRAAKRAFAEAVKLAVGGYGFPPGRLIVDANPGAQVFLAGGEESTPHALDFNDQVDRDEVDRKTVALIDLAASRGERLTYWQAAEQVIRQETR